MKRKRLFLPSLGFALLVGAARWAFECLVVVPIVPDAQNGIWIMVSTITSFLLVVMLLPLTWIALSGQRSESSLRKVLAIVPVLLALAWIGSGFLKLAGYRTALLDSANPSTDPERLRVLADYSSGAGYEIDNRVAMNPNTPPDVLRSLHGRPDQVGTEMCLAQNPNTPDDILVQLAIRKDEWSKHILDGLQRNPRYKEVMSLLQSDNPEISIPESSIPVPAVSVPTVSVPAVDTALDHESSSSVE